jgi:hypothetical protein
MRPSHGRFTPLNRRALSPVPTSALGHKTTCRLVRTDRSEQSLDSNSGRPSRWRCTPAETCLRSRLMDAERMLK